MSEVGTCSVVAWTPDLAYANESIIRYFPMCVWSEHSATDHTYSDVMQHITERFRTMTDPEVLHEWSGSGYCFIFHSVQGDLKWFNEKYALFDFRGDFRLTAKHRESTPDLTRFHEMSPPSIFSLPCMGPQRVRHDILHSQLLGTGKISNGSGKVYLSEAGFWCSPFQVRGGETIS